MGRRRVKLALIADDSSRKLSYKKRKRGMLKKIEELSTLCGIEACAIVYSPNDPVPEVWPSPSSVHRLLEKFMAMPELEQYKKMVNQESFISQRILKGNEQIMKLMMDNREKEMTIFMYQCLNAGMIQYDNNMTATDLNALSAVIEQNLKGISERLETLKGNEMTPNQPQMQTPSSAIAKTKEMTSLNNGHGLDMYAGSMQSQWFVDLLNGNGEETIMPPFGDANLQLQTGFWPYLLP